MGTRILLVDDDPLFGEALAASLGHRGFEVVWQPSGEDALAWLDVESADVVVTDLAMRGLGGIELCRRIAASRGNVPVIVVTAFGSLETAVAAIRAGAYDFITKPVQVDVLAIALGRAAQHFSLREEVRRLRKEVQERPHFDDIFGASPAMQKVHGLVDQVAESDAAVLITGERGTGKEIVARALHRRSRRHAGPFVAVNCAAIPEPVLAKELFGQAHGDFGGPKEARQGLFLQAHNGTLFLDEIGYIPLGLQPMLLHVLRERSVRALGGTEETPFDVRVVAATNLDLESALESGRFREDLYFCINVVHIELPPLRARTGDILPLAQRFLVQFAERASKDIRGISPNAAEKLLAYAWPGNVRELQNCIERAVALAGYEELTSEDLPERIRDYRSTDLVVLTDNPTELISMEELERRYILRVLDVMGGNKTAAARVLGFERRTLYRKLEHFGVNGSAPDGSTISPQPPRGNEAPLLEFKRSQPRPRRT